MVMVQIYIYRFSRLDNQLGGCWGLGSFWWIRGIHYRL